MDLEGAKRIERLRIFTEGEIINHAPTLSSKVVGLNPSYTSYKNRFRAIGERITVMATDEAGQKVVQRYAGAEKKATVGPLESSDICIDMLARLRGRALDSVEVVWRSARLGDNNEIVTESIKATDITPGIAPYSHIADSIARIEESLDIAEAAHAGRNTGQAPVCTRLN